MPQGVEQAQKVHIEIQLAYARRELELCQAAKQEQPQLTAAQYALLLTVKRAIIHTLERVADEERTHHVRIPQAELAGREEEEG